MKYIYRQGKIIPKHGPGYVGINRGPYVISDTMDAVEQVDGKFYTSKSQFRAVGRSLGLIEVGTEKFKPRQRASSDRAAKEARVRAIRKALAQWAATGARGRVQVLVIFIRLGTGLRSCVHRVFGRIPLTVAHSWRRMTIGVAGVA